MKMSNIDWDTYIGNWEISIGQGYDVKMNPDLIDYDISAELSSGTYIGDGTAFPPILLDNPGIIWINTSAPSSPWSEDPTDGIKVIKYIRKGKTTPKAIFFITEDETVSGVHGFWCPKGVIEKDIRSELHVRDWFEPKIVEFL